MNQELQALKDQHLELGKRISELEERMKKEEGKGWIPKLGECYYYFDYDTGYSVMNINGGHKIDQNRLSIGNVYKSQEEAEHIGPTKLRRLQFEHELQLKIKELNGEWEYNIGGRYLIPVYDLSINSVLWEAYHSWIIPNFIKVKSKEVGKQLESHFGERLIKYIKGEEL